MTILEEVADLRRLSIAWRFIERRGERAVGVDEITISIFGHNHQNRLQEISSQLLHNKFFFDRVVHKEISKGSSGKKREIGLFTIRDKVVLKSIQLVFENPKRAPLLFPDINNSVSVGFISRSDREFTGVKKAIERVKQYKKHGLDFMYVADIDNFFPSIDRSHLKKIINQHLPDRSLEHLINQILDPVMCEKDLYTSEYNNIPSSSAGVTQGSVLSPMLSNIYMMGFDKTLEALNIPAIRYADDIACFAHDDKSAKSHLYQIINLLKKYKLTLHPPKTVKAPRLYLLNNHMQWATLLGIDLQYAKKAGKRFWLVKPSRSKVDKIKSVIRKELYNSQNSLFERIIFLNNHYRGWCNAYDHLKCTEGIMSHIKREIKDVYEKELSLLFLKVGLTSKHLTKSQLLFLGVLKGTRSRYKKTD